MRNIRNKISNITIILIYIFMFFPMAFSMWNAVPACDDFAFGTRSISNNLFLDAIGYSAFCYFDHSGRWLLFFLQKLINPLNSHVHLGRVYGVWMIVLFLLTFVALYYSLRVIIEKLFGLKDTALNVAILLVNAVLFTTYYYVEVYNWYIGGTAYAVPLVCMLLTFAFLIRFEDTLQKKYYVGVILAGLLPATNETFDLPLGIIYLYLIFYVFRIGFSDMKKLINRMIPLLIFIIGGMTSVFAPGNFARQDAGDKVPVFSVAARVTLIDISIRVKELLHHPFAIFLFACLIILGFKACKKTEAKHLIIPAIVVFVVTYCTLFPYVYGHATTNTFVEVRMLYLVEFLMFIGICFWCIRLGAFVGSVTKLELTNGKLAIVMAILCVGTIAVLARNNNYLKIVQLDMIDKRGLIEESYVYWDDILTEIENSTESDIVIYRDVEPTWTPYFLYSGIATDDVYDIPLDRVFQIGKIMPNVYYQKESIRYVLGEN